MNVQLFYFEIKIGKHCSIGFIFAHKSINDECDMLSKQIYSGILSVSFDLTIKENSLKLRP